MRSGKNVSGSKRLRARRENLYRRSPFCHWCGTRTVLPARDQDPKTFKPNTATVDHLRPRNHPGRTDKAAYQETRTVLACIKCNMMRGEIQSRDPFIGAPARAAASL